MSESLSAETPLSPGADPSTAPRKKLERSCLACHRRKVRCSKELPCSTCVKNHVACSYPPAGRKRRAPNPKTRITDIATRVSQLERTLVSSSRASEPPPRATTSSRDTSRVAEAPYTPYSQTQDGYEVNKEALVENQYYNEDLLSRVIEQERDIHSALATPRNNPPKLRPFNPMGILSNPLNFTGELAALHPPKQAAMQLWRVFVQNVGPAVHVFHTPTTEINVYSVIHDATKAHPDTLALVFSIYFTAAITLEPEEAEKLLGRDKESGLMMLKTGVEQAFAEADFLSHTSTTLLQALAIYLVLRTACTTTDNLQMGIRSHNPGRGVWILTGLAVRAAESAGLHRDGKKLKLTPFESEIRRRIWWHIVGRDGRSSEDYGISSSNNIPLSTVELPLNVNDGALYPEMTKLPTPSLGWTEMTLSLVGMEMFRAWTQLQTAITSSPPPDRAVRDKIISDWKIRVEPHIQRCNPIVPIQRMTIFVFRFTFTKFDIVSRQQWACIEHPKQPDFTSEALEQACETLQMVIDAWDDELLFDYRWLYRSFTQYHLPLYILWHLCLRPQGPCVARAWEVIDALFRLQEAGTLQLSASANGSKWAVIKVLREKASLIREAVHNRDKTIHAATSAMQLHEEAVVEQTTDGAEINVDIANDPELSQFLDPLPDWNTFWLEEFNLSSLA
ncbi:hypothetical protein SLS62_002015 [Diatrype stigma]|uniref:Zn(2)-C6 fungal-type domain-containing protein n=1 Tax=Diatrype stigma TaxID=117547 RepID=A0AAN9UZ82_9PEZI